MKGGVALLDTFTIKSTDLLSFMVGLKNVGGYGALKEHENGTLMQLSPPLTFSLRASRVKLLEPLTINKPELVVTGHFIGLITHGPRWALDYERFEYKETNVLAYKKAIALGARCMNRASVAKGEGKKVPQATIDFMSSLLD